MEKNLERTLSESPTTLHYVTNGMPFLDRFSDERLKEKEESLSPAHVAHTVAKAEPAPLPVNYHTRS